MALPEALFGLEPCQNPEHDQDHRNDRESSPALPSLPPQQNQLGPSYARARPNLTSRRSTSRKRPLFRSQFQGAKSSVTQQEADAAIEADLAAAFNTSSDPAFFSSDETPDLENYSRDGGNKRKKKVYSGTWWSGRLRSGSNNSGKSDGSEKSKSVSFGAMQGTKRRKKDRQFRRNFDSGIFMADEMESSESSSGMELSSDGLMDELEAERSRTLEKLQSDRSGVPTGNAWRSSVDDGEGFPARPMKKLALHEIIAQKPSALDTRINDIVQQCLEQGDADIDLTNMGIENLPKSIIELRTMVRPQDPINLPFAPFSGRLRLYLANNRLSLFPGQLLKIPNIELLSVRQNRLSQLPDGIIELRHLRELNISGNELQCLPFNILKLCYAKLKTIQSEPNPWKPFPNHNRLVVNNAASLVLNQPERSVRRVLVEAATNFEANGMTKRESTIGCRSPAPLRSPSLSEVILRQLDKLHTVGSDLSMSSETELCSENVRDMLHKLYLYQHEGRRICTFCERNLIMPKYQWLEWWRIIDFDVSRGEINNDPRFQVIPSRGEEFDKTAHDVDGIDDEDEEISNANAEHGELASEPGKLLPFLRVSCGCRTQHEGLTEERKMIEDLAESCKDGSSAGHRMWPTLASWKE